MRFLKLLRTFVRLSTMNEIQYRANFFVQLMNSVLELVTGLGGLGLVFYHTNSLDGWGPDELLAVMGVYILLGGWISIAVQPNMGELMRGINQGTLDYNIIKPADTQVLASINQLQIWKFVDVLSGLAVITAAVIRLGIKIGWANSLMFVAALLSSAVILYCLWLIIATTAFWWVRVWSIMAMFQSFYQTGRWPVGIYPNWLKFSLTFLVPVAFAVTVPAEVLTGRIAGSTLITVVGVAVGLAVISRLFWLYGLRNYSGASA